ncbi:MAG TPA: ABC transporter permease [Gammaproteobacteria bacterium]|nr:ABC transporter permease [Gammaproteobacteria bacterium]
MLFGEIIRIAFQSILANLFRGILTMLGIIIGVAAVITMLAAGAGAQKRIDDQIAALGANILTLTESQFFSRGVSREQLTLLIDDLEALETQSRYIDAVVPELRNRAQIKLGNANSNTRLIGTSYQYHEMFHYPLALGRFFTRAEDEQKRRVVVLGARVPERLETSAERMLGNQVLINTQPFEVIGVLAEIGDAIGGSPDTSVFIPLYTAEARVLGQGELDNISLRIKDGVSFERAMVDIERVMRTEHRIQPGKPNDFAIVDRRQFLATQQEAQQTFTMLLASIAGVSLIVGGIGIMNIMLVSVTERTREIGIRMALGATRLNILLQFLVESVALCLFGGILGIATGVGLAVALSSYAGWQTSVAPESVIMAFAFSIAVGLFFGSWPAHRASRLDPIEALRYE